MKKLQSGIWMVLGGLLVLTLSARAVTQSTRDTQEPGQPTVVVGTFDSRAVAIAYVRSDASNERMRALLAELARAKQAGNEERVAELEALGPAMQRRIHEQGFGNAPIDDVVAHIEDRLPGIAEEAGVDVIVSKWVLAYSRPKACFVDVTDTLVAEFDPDEETWKVVREVMKREPVPLDQLDHEH